jgi:Putative Holin-like Toxin (Hol-Tox)
MQGGQWLLPYREGVLLMITVTDTLTLMISFATLIVAVIAISKEKK